MHEHQSIASSERCQQRIEAVERRFERAAGPAQKTEQQLLAVCAHELRNPLSSLQSTLDLMRGQFASPALDPHLEVLLRQTRKLERIVEDLLDVARAAQGKLELRAERIDMVVVVARAIESTRHLIDERRHALVLRAPGRPIHVTADPERLEQVFVNLLVNAAKYTEPGGRIAVEIRGSAGEVEVRVRDSGMGMTREALAHAFELFTQFGNDMALARGGLGVGLAVVKQLVEMHDGRVRAFSDGPGRGAEILVTLPMAAEVSEVREAHPRREAFVPQRVPATAPKRVLVVDDNQDLAEALGRLIDYLGHRVCVANDGPSALRAAAELNPEVAFVDICLGEMDGYAVARALARASVAPPLLVALTGYADESARVRAREAGFCRHLVKPPRLAAIQAVLSGCPERVSSR
jgi:two-component system CheB/CheR fusion protein